MNAPYNPSNDPNDTLTGGFSEDAVVTSVTGSFTFQDDGRDNGSADAHGVLAVPPPGAVGTLDVVLLDDASGLNGAGPDDIEGTIQWTYTVNPLAVQYLAVGESLVQVFNIQIVDLDGNTLTVPITITITGANDFPVISTASPSHAFGEDDATTLSISSTLAFTDVDATDVHSVSNVAVATGGTTTGWTLIPRVFWPC